MQITSVNFLVTFRCNASCQHCGYRAGPTHLGYMRVSDANQWLTTLSATQPLQSITIHGGEPLLFFPNYCVEKLLQMATTLNIPRRGIITNGFWAIDQETARRKLTKLKSCGLTSITFSVDAFHQEYIPLNTLRLGIKEAMALGVTKISVLSHYLVSVNAENVYNQKTNKILAEIEDIDGIHIERFKTSFYGRAAENFAGFVEKTRLRPSGPCHLPYWLGGKLKHPKAIEIDFNGYVTLCPGICIGNLKTQSLTDVLSNYDPNTHPILKVLVQEGPIGLARMADEGGIDYDQQFVDECHLCYEMRQLLQQHFPSHLAPSSCYLPISSRRTGAVPVLTHRIPPCNPPTQRGRGFPRVV